MGQIQPCSENSSVIRTRAESKIFWSKIYRSIYSNDIIIATIKWDFPNKKCNDGVQNLILLAPIVSVSFEKNVYVFH